MAFFNRSSGPQGVCAGAAGLARSGVSPAAAPPAPAEPPPPKKDEHGRPISPARLAALEKQKVIEAVAARQEKAAAGVEEWLELELVDQDGEPVGAGWTFEVADESARVSSGTFDPGARTRLEQLKPGTVSVTVRVPSQSLPPAASTPPTAPGSEPKKDAVLATLELELVDEDGAPIEGQWKVTDARGRTHAKPAAGTASFEGLPEGEVTLQLVPRAA